MVSDRPSLDGGGSAAAPVSYSEIFYEHLPYYIQIGMSADEFWHGSPIMAKIYREAWKLRLKKENRDMWLQGLYIYSALCAVSPVMHAFAKNGTKPIPYLDEPIPVTKEEIREKRERDARARYERIKRSTDSWMISANVRLSKQTAKEVSKDE